MCLFPHLLSSDSCGGIAQLAERLICIQEVASSILVASTNFKNSNDSVSEKYENKVEKEVDLKDRLRLELGVRANEKLVFTS